MVDVHQYKPGFKPKNEPIKVISNSTLEEAIEEVRNNEYKIVLVKTESLMAAFTHIGNTKAEGKKVPIIFMPDVLFEASKEYSIEELVRPQPHKDLKPYDLPPPQFLFTTNEDGTPEVIRFPFLLDEKLTEAICKNFLLKGLESSVKKNKLDPEKITVIGFFRFDFLFGETHIDVYSEVKFLKAIFELSKEYILLLGDPTNVYHTPPMEVAVRLLDLKKKKILPTPFNVAELPSQKIAEEIIANSVRIVLEGVKLPGGGTLVFGDSPTKPISKEKKPETKKQHVVKKASPKKQTPKTKKPPSKAVLSKDALLIQELVGDKSAVTIHWLKLKTGFSVERITIIAQEELDLIVLSGAVRKKNR